MYGFGQKSNEQLATCSPELIAVARSVILLVDHSILQGARTTAEQTANVAAGVSQTMNSKHLSTPARAFDFAPHHPKFGVIVGTPSQMKDIAQKTNKRLGEIESWVREQYTYIAGMYIAAGNAMGHKLISGCDWNRNGDLFDNRFDDMGHIELA